PSSIPHNLTISLRLNNLNKMYCSYGENFDKAIFFLRASLWRRKRERVAATFRPPSSSLVIAKLEQQPRLFLLRSPGARQGLSGSFPSSAYLAQPPPATGPDILRQHVD